MTDIQLASVGDEATATAISNVISALGLTMMTSQPTSVTKAFLDTLSHLNNTLIGDGHLLSVLNQQVELQRSTLSMLPVRY